MRGDALSAVIGPGPESPAVATATARRIASLTYPVDRVGGVGRRSPGWGPVIIAMMITTVITRSHTMSTTKTTTNTNSTTDSTTTTDDRAREERERAAREQQRSAEKKKWGTICPDCGVCLDRRGLSSHQGSNPCQARQDRAQLALTHVQVPKWVLGLDPLAEGHEVHWEAGSVGRYGRWVTTIWVPRGPRASWYQDHGLDAARDKGATRRQLTRMAGVVLRFGASAAAQLQGDS